jgi:hypothetical protein
MAWDDGELECNVPESTLAWWRTRFGTPMRPSDVPRLREACRGLLARYDEATANLLDASNSNAPLTGAQVEYLEESLKLFIAELRRRGDVDDADR